MCTKSHRTTTNNGVAVVMSGYSQEFFLLTSGSSSVSSARLTSAGLRSDYQVSYDEQTGKVSFHSLEPHSQYRIAHPSAVFFDPCGEHAAVEVDGEDALSRSVSPDRFTDGPGIPSVL